MFNKCMCSRALWLTRKRVADKPVRVADREVCVGVVFGTVVSSAGSVAPVKGFEKLPGYQHHVPQICERFQVFSGARASPRANITILLVSTPTLH